MNGEDRTVAAGSSVADLLRELAINPDTVVVELNREIIRERDRLELTTLATGDEVEIVHFVGGG